MPARETSPLPKDAPLFVQVRSRKLGAFGPKHPWGPLCKPADDTSSNLQTGRCVPLLVAEMVEKAKEINDG